MLLRVSIDSKTIQNKRLFQDLNFSIEQNEKIAIIGRNGVGKTTLFRMLTGQDTDYQGTIEFKKGTRIVNTDQEQKSITGESALEYALRNLPEYEELKKIIDDLPQTMGEDLKKIELYTNSLERFTNLGYYTVSDELVMSLLDYQLSEQQIYGPFARLSGGQKRFIDLARIELSNAQITLIDEPTNHMDYVAKTAFINWFKSAKNTVITITHDRDVLHAVTKIIEIKDGKALIYKGNYDDYLKQNATGTSTQMHDYEISKRTLENLKKQIQAVRAKKASTNKTPNPFIPLEKRLMKEKETLESQLERPSFWIDKDSLSSLRKTAVENYDKYKAKNIKISRTKENEGKRELIFVDQLQLGYTNTPLFNPITFRLHHGDKIQLVGRNGAGKTTLIKAITETSQGKRPTTWEAGSIFCDNKLRLSIYEQELDIRSLNFTLFNAIQWIYDQVAQSIDAQQTLRIMSDYLFDPLNDAQILVKDLSGGQKARLQIIRMLANNPNLLILDEPTNHLDLPSIEELESALATYHGGILYVSHDTYFSRKLGGEIIHILTTS